MMSVGAFFFFFTEVPADTVSPYTSTGPEVSCCPLVVSKKSTSVRELRFFDSDPEATSMLRLYEDLKHQRVVHGLFRWSLRIFIKYSNYIENYVNLFRVFF